jgi:antirestriction protein
MEIIINNKLDVTDCTIKDIFNIVGLLEESYDPEASIALMIDVRCYIKEYERQWENYIGFFDSEEESCKDYIEQSDEIPDHYKFYIDYQRLARDVFCDLMPIYANCGVYVFHS